MDFYAAINAHVAWKARLESCVRQGNPEGLEARAVGDEHACALGAWMADAASVPYRELLLWDKLLEAHGAFHRCAAQVVHLVAGGDGAGAEALLAGRFAALSHDVVRLLTRLALTLR